MSFCPADAAVFRRILANDPECKACFECGSINPQWCDVNHAVFICLECSGVHRSLGVHLSFVRSSTMDGWTNWNPLKLKQMELGGNRRARLYFEKNGVPTAPIRARYESLPALRYAAMLECEAEGQAFNEATWQPPPWYTRMKAAPPQTAGSPTTADPNRFAGIGSEGSVLPKPDQPSTNKTGGGDWFSSLSSGWNLVSQRAGELAQQASATVQQADVDKVRDTATRGWSTVAASLANISTTVTQKWNEVAAPGGLPEEDGLDALTGHARAAAQGQSVSGVTDDRFRGYGNTPAGASSPQQDGQVAWGTTTGFRVASPTAGAPMPPTASTGNNTATAGVNGPVLAGHVVGSAVAGSSTTPAAAKSEKWGWDDEDW